jgi:ubiquinone/menaquinone biosynthesis C-methylase UbiE
MGLRPGPELFDCLIPHQPIVDPGCGSGQLCLALAQSGFFRVTGVCQDEAGLARARQAAARLTVRPLPRFLVADVTSLPFADNAFEGAIMQGLLTKLAVPEDRRLALREAQRVLAPAGNLYLAVLSQTWHEPRYRERYAEGERLTGEVGTVPARRRDTGETVSYAHHFSEPELVRLLENAGLQVRQFRYEVVTTPSGREVGSMRVVAAKPPV